MQVTFGNLSDWVSGHLTTDDVNRMVEGVSTDSRTIEEGELFVALRGPNYDGHDYVSQAKSRGASVMLVDNSECLEGANGILVPDTLTALGDIAHCYRWQQPLIPWVAVTGSNGKTTTREMVACILEKHGPVTTSHGNYNNYVGLPLSILSRSLDAWVGVVEIGASEPGEVKRLAHIASPTVSIVTCTGPAHLEGFGTLETIAHEKAAIFEKVPYDGVAIYPAHDAHADILASHIPGSRASFSTHTDADMVAENIENHEEGVSFVVRGVQFELPLLGTHNVNNCLAALLAAEHLGVGLEDAAVQLREMRAVRQRLEKTTTEYFTILNDTYNANPSSLHAATDVLTSFHAPRRVVIVGDMLELGTQSRELHREVGRELARQGIDVIVAIGKQALHLAEAASAANARTTVRHYGNVTGFLQKLKNHVQADDAILVKGSRGMKMELVVEALKRFDPDAKRSTGIFRNRTE